MKDEYGELVYPFAIQQSKGERFSVIPFNFSLAANEEASVVYTLSTGWNFVTSVINSYSTGEFKLNIRDVYTHNNLFIDDIRASLITGTGQRSFIMPKTHEFEGGRTIEVIVTDLSGAANTVELALIGYKESILCEPITVRGKGFAASPTKYGKAAVEPVSYIVDRLFVVPFDFTMAGSTYTSKYPISTGFDFMWEVMNAYTAREFTLQLKDEYVTEEFFSSPVRSSNITGTGQRSFILPRPYIFEGGTHITVTITDTDPLGASTPVQLALIGYKVKKIG